MWVKRTFANASQRRVALPDKLESRGLRCEFSFRRKVAKTGWGEAKLDETEFGNIVTLTCNGAQLGLVSDFLYDNFIPLSDSKVCQKLYMLKYCATDDKVNKLRRRIGLRWFDLDNICGELDEDTRLRELEKLAKCTPTSCFQE